MIFPLQVLVKSSRAIAPLLGDYARFDTTRKGKIRQPLEIQRSEIYARETNLLAFDNEGEMVNMLHPE